VRAQLRLALRQFVERNAVGIRRIHFAHRLEHLRDSIAGLNHSCPTSARKKVKTRVNRCSAERIKITKIEKKKRKKSSFFFII
jgi:hypothetical protein